MTQRCLKCGSEFLAKKIFCAVCGTLNSSFQIPSKNSFNLSQNETFEAPSSFLSEQIQQRNDFNNPYASPLTESVRSNDCLDLDYYQVAKSLKRLIVCFLLMILTNILILIPIDYSNLSNSSSEIIFLLLNGINLVLMIILIFFIFRCSRNLKEGVIAATF